MKRLLLNDTISKDIMSGPCGNDVFEGLLNQMRGICTGSCDGEVLRELMERIGGMLVVLGGDQSRH